MAALRDIQNKISAVKKTRQITRAMNMVSAAKLRGVQDATERFRPYAQKYTEVLASLSAGVDPETHPLLAQPEEVKSVGLIQLSADRGLCGSFNMNLIHQGERFVNERKAQGQQIELFVVGKRARDYFRRRKVEMAEAMTDAMNVIDFELAVSVGRLGLDAFLSDSVQEVYISYTRFESMAAQVPALERLLPIAPEAEVAEAAADASAVEYITEPSAEEILVDLLPRYLNVRIYQALLETSTSEHAARMMAMDNATNACKDMIDNLTLLYNKARQAAITTELMDIVGGAEALKGG
jgi:F-type H+-transporting ATPase subunit gamma